MNMQDVMDLLEAEACNNKWRKNPEELVDEYACGNVDDAYDGGFNDGKKYIAERILDYIREYKHDFDEMKFRLDGLCK